MLTWCPENRKQANMLVLRGGRKSQLQAVCDLTEAVQHWTDR